MCSLLLFILPLAYLNLKVDIYEYLTNDYYKDSYGLELIKELPQQLVSLSGDKEKNWSSAASRKSIPRVACYIKRRPIAVYDKPKGNAKYELIPLDGVYGEWKKLTLEKNDHKGCDPFIEFSKEGSYLIDRSHKKFLPEGDSGNCVAISVIKNKEEILFLEQIEKEELIFDNFFGYFKKLTTIIKNKKTDEEYMKFVSFNGGTRGSRIFHAGKMMGMKHVDIISKMFVKNRSLTDKEKLYKRLKIQQNRLIPIILRYNFNELSSIENGVIDFKDEECN